MIAQSLHNTVPFIKRVFDIVVAVITILVLSPLMVIIALLIALFSGFPVLFMQIRPGFKGQLFSIYKFRTMRQDRDGIESSLTDGQRLTRIGRFLRATSLDELPELFNVLKGEMSFVGPRPLLVQYLELYDLEQMRRHDVLPGITGWAQIHGRNAISWQEKFKLDVWYVDHWSFWLDIKILFLTIWKTLKREGINQPGHISSELFRGNIDKK